MKQIGDDDRLKPDNWQLKRCMNCEHLKSDQAREALPDYMYCGIPENNHVIHDAEEMGCDQFKSRYRNYDFLVPGTPSNLAWTKYLKGELDNEDV